MRGNRVTRLPALVFAAWIAALQPGCGEPARPVQVEGSGLALEATLDPERPRTGSNALELRLQDRSGNPVDAAELEVRVHMPAMGAMPAMGGPVSVEELGAGRYRAPFELSMEGTWRVAIRARAPEGTLRAEGSLVTGSPGLGLRTAGGAGPGAATPGEVVLDPARLQRIGVRFAPAARTPFPLTIRALGIVRYDPGSLVDVAPRIAGFVGRVPVPAAGEHVERGALLFTYYAPELYAAQKELLTALAARAAAAPSAAARDGALVEAARSRLRLLGLPEAVLGDLEETRRAVEYVPYRAPRAGVVVERNAVPGAAAEAGKVLFRLASMDRVWVEAELYESELRQVGVGDEATIRLPYLPDEPRSGRISLVEPELTAATRTARARIELPNPGGALLPGMWADVEIVRDLGERLTVPASAVLHAGDRRFVFVDLGDGRLRPRAVETGLRSGDRLEVRSGLVPGERIVVSGTYLVASESRLSTALEDW